MLTYRTMTPSDEGLARQMMEEFYTTDAVCAPPPAQRVEENVTAAISPENTAFRGVLVSEGDSPVGYMMLTTFFSGAVGGICVVIEQLYVSAACRGRGVGGEMLRWLREEYSQARRFQLEVSENNSAARHLYERCGYELNPYQTMYINI